MNDKSFEDKPLTLRQLNEALDPRFAAVDARFDEVSKRIDELKDQIDRNYTEHAEQINLAYGRHEIRLNVVEGWYRSLDGRFTRIEERVQKLESPQR